MSSSGGSLPKDNIDRPVEEPASMDNQVYCVPSLNEQADSAESVVGVTIEAGDLEDAEPSGEERTGQNTVGNTEAFRMSVPDVTIELPVGGDTAKLSVKPTTDQSWEVLAKEVNSLDEGLVEGWREDLDTLLIFAGLFSAVATAFTIESYQWLKEAPEDVTVALLKQISQQLNNSVVSERDRFQASVSDVRINVLWFMSLVIALVVALFALLCKQWLREHRRHAHTRTPSEALALSWLRTQSLEKWHVHTILASLPILLEIAVFLFLAGVMVLLWDRSIVVFGTTTQIIVLAALAYLITSLIPTVDIVRQALQVTPKLREMRTQTGHFRRHSLVDALITMPPMEFVCPYKSPQAWAVFQAFRLFSSLPGFVRTLFLLFRRDYISSHLESTDNISGTSVNSSKWAFDGTLSGLLDWSSVDLEIIQRSDIIQAPPFHKLHTFRWLVSEFKDSPVMVTHLRNVLKTLPVNLVMPGVLDQRPFSPDGDWTADDIENVLSSNPIPIHQRRSFREFQEGTAIVNRLLHCTYVLNRIADLDTSDRKKLKQHVLSQLLVRRQQLSPEFHRIGMPTIDKLASILDLDCDHIWDPFGAILESILENPKAKKEYWVALMPELASYITASCPEYTLHGPRTKTTSAFVESVAGKTFLSKMHTVILERKVWQHTEREDDIKWMESMDIVRRVHQLGNRPFDPIPGYFPLSPSSLHKALHKLSPGNSVIDFDYLDSFRRHWDQVLLWHKKDLITVLSHHINNYPQSDTTSPKALPDSSRVSPLVTSTPGQQLIAFITNQLAEDWKLFQYIDLDVCFAWFGAIQRVRQDCRLPQDWPNAQNNHNLSASERHSRHSSTPEEAPDIVDTVGRNRTWPFKLRLWMPCGGCGGCDICGESRC